MSSTPTLPATDPAHEPALRHGNQGPFSEADLLAIGAVLVVVLAILGLRRIARTRRR